MRTASPREIVGSWSDITERKQAEAGGGSGARPGRAPARSLTCGDLQLQGERRLRADLRQPQHQGPARLRARGVSRQPGFLARAASTPTTWSASWASSPPLPGRAPQRRVSLSQEGRLLLLGQRRAASDPRRGGRAARDRRLMERHHRAQAARRGAGRRAGSSRAICSSLGARGDLQLSRRPAISRRPSSARTSGTGWATSRANIWRTRISGGAACTPTTSPRWRPSPSSCSRKGRHTVEYRFLKKDGTYCWVNDEQRLIRDAGRPARRSGRLVERHHRAQAAEEAVAAARERVEHLLASSPAVIYSFKATGDYAPTFISQNVKDLLGYDREEYLESPDFWRSRVHPEDSPRILRAYRAAVRGGASHQRVPLPQEGRQLLLGQRRAAGAPRRGGRSDRGGRRLERHHGAQAARRGPGRRAGPSRAPAVVARRR